MILDDLPRHEWWATILRERARGDVNLRDAVEALIAWYAPTDDICADCPFFDGGFPEADGDFDHIGPRARPPRMWLTIKPSDVYL